MYNSHDKPETKLTTIKDVDLAEAAFVIGEHRLEGHRRYIPMMVSPSGGGCKWWVEIPEGFQALVTSYGRFVGIWKAGFHICRPWERVSHLVSKQYITYDLPVKECPTMDNVMVEIDVSVVIHIIDEEQRVQDFVYKLGPENLEDMLRERTQEAVRVMARKKRYFDIYDLMDTEEFDKKAHVVQEVDEDGVPITKDDVELKSLTPSPAKRVHSEDRDVGEQLEVTKKQMNEKLGAYGVAIYSITITNVHLPSQFRKQMEEATTFSSKAALAAAEQKYNMLVISDNEKLNQSTQTMNEKKAEANTKIEERLALERKLTDNVVAETAKLVSQLKEDLKVDVLTLRADTSLKCAEIDAARDLELAQIAAETEAEVRKIKAESDAYIIAKKAEASREAALLDAQALEIEASAEAKAGVALGSLRDYNAKMSHLTVLKNLALNKKLVLTTQNKGDVIAQLVGAQRAAINVGLVSAP